MAEENFDLVVIGAGPGGYVAAIRAAQLGMRVACIDKQYLGGTCLNVGCIPSKAWLDASHKLYQAKHKFKEIGIQVADVRADVTAMAARKDKVVQQNTAGVGYLFKKNKVETIMGAARIASPASVAVKLNAGGERTLNAKRILVATGSAPIRIKSLPFDGKHIINSDHAVNLTEAPKKMVVVGAGVIGVEIGSVWSRLGTEVLVIEFMDRILPGMDREMTSALQRLLEKQGLKFKLKAAAESAKVEAGRVKLAWASGDEKAVEDCDKVLVAVGRRPFTESLGLAEAGVQTDPKGFVKVDGKYQTNVPGIYAIGDVIGGLMLAHKAEEEGVAAAELMAGKAGHVNYHACPNVVYTHPELAQVGYTEEDAQKAGHEVRVGKFPFSANGRARCMDDTDGLVKIVGDAKTDRLLGVHVLGPEASDLIAEAVVAVEFAASCEDVARSFHAHPTLAEAIKEAALGVEKRSIHI